MQFRKIKNKKRKEGGRETECGPRLSGNLKNKAVQPKCEERKGRALGTHTDPYAFIAE